MTIPSYGNEGEDFGGDGGHRREELPRSSIGSGEVTRESNGVDVKQGGLFIFLLTKNRPLL